MGKLFLLVSGIYIVASMQDIVSFTIWPSVLEFLGDLESARYFQKDWEDIFFSPWGVRTGIAIPSILLAEWTSLTQEQSFGLYCGFCLSLTAFLINRTMVECLGTKLWHHELVVAGMIFGIGYFMNGRLCPAFVGSAMIMRAHLCWICERMPTRRVLLYNFLGLPLLTVSSGTFIVGLVTVVLWLTLAMFDCRQNGRGRLRTGVLLGMLPVLYLALVQTSLFTNKLYDYYEGDMVQVLYHGYGEFISDYLPELTGTDVILILAMTLPVVGLFVARLIRPLSWPSRYLFFSVAISLCLGACGYSTMLTNLPSMVLCAAHLLTRRRAPAHLAFHIARAAA